MPNAMDGLSAEPTASAGRARERVGRPRRGACARPLQAIAADVLTLSGRARAGQLRPEDMAGGTFTISNLGLLGVDAFTPIINPPQSAILGIGRIQPRPVVREGTLAIGRTCVLSLTFDHRVADGAPAARLLDALVRRLGDREVLAGLG
ncbi:MAG: 2-oxo acid dehydrogenase subunit E2 [Chloroflexi bacterium]|nr:2-oxo acid dehydrogenase subunit E2 [Chloroflexota bacterium]